MEYKKYVLDKILKVQVVDENGNVIAESEGQEGLPTSYDNYELTGTEE